MSMKQLFYAAFTARVISWLTLIAFFVCMYADLELRTAVLCLGVSHLAWILGTMFLGVFREQMVEVASRVMADMVEESAELEPAELGEIKSHPIFDEEETND